MVYIKKLTFIIAIFISFSLLFGTVHADAEDNNILLKAVSNNNNEKVAKLIDNKINVNQEKIDFILRTAESNNNKELVYMIETAFTENTDLRSYLKISLDRNYPNLLKVLITKGIDLNQVLTSEGQTALMAAVYYRRKEMTKILIENGADINAVDRNGKSVLMYAAETWAPEITRILIDNGANLDHRNPQGQKAIDVAYNNDNYVAYIIIEIALGKSQNKYDQYLTAAVYEDIPSLANILIQEGADVNAKYEGSVPLIHLAIREQSYEMFDLLIENGVNIRAEDDYGNQPLDLVLNYFDTRMLKELIKKGITIEELSEKDVLYRAVYENRIDMAKYLIDKGLKINKTNESGESPLTRAVIEDNQEMVKMLLDNGANINQVDPNGETPLFAAVDHSHYEITKLLLNKGANINHVNSYGQTLTDIAISPYGLKTLKLLLENNGDINKPDRSELYDTFKRIITEEEIYLLSWMLKNKNKLELDVNADLESGFTPLMAAANVGSILATSLLLEEGADMDITNDRGDTALDIAVYMERNAVYSLLLSYSGSD